MCALLVLALPAALVATATPAEAKRQGDLGAQLLQHRDAARQSRQVLRFFASHAWLLDDPRFAAEAKRQRARHTKLLAQATAQIRATTRAIAARHAARAARRAQQEAAAVRETAAARRAAQRARSVAPRQAICKVFGDHCDEAIRVAHCESRLETGAQNGQYLGLFQMGSSERELFGHGSTALEQAKAAHRYFVRSGRDWSPWSCKP